MADDISTMLVELEEDELLRCVREALSRGDEPLALVEQLREGMGTVGKRFEEKEYYLSELIMSAEIFKQAIALIEPHMSGAAGESRGRIVIGTVQGDIHGIGKNIVATLLRCEGYEVHDLGEDVPPRIFVEKVMETGAGLVALSGLLTVAFDAMKETADALSAAGLRPAVKVIIGGGPVNESVVEYAGADDWGRDAAQAVKLAGRFLGDRGA
jgi:methanogenic corrinoid protein MtbC1